MSEPMSPPAFDLACRRAGWLREGNTAVVPLAGGRRQRVAVTMVADDAGDFVRIASRIGDAAVLNQARMAAALRLNARLRRGATAVLGEDVALVDTAAGDIGADELHAVVALLARTADDYEKAPVRAGRELTAPFRIIRASTELALRGSTATIASIWRSPDPAHESSRQQAGGNPFRPA